MSTDLEKDLAAALRRRAGEVPDVPCPPLTAAAPTPRRGWVMPVTAAAAAVVGLVVAGVVLLPGDGGPQRQDAVVGQAPEVYYSRVVSGVPGENLAEVELWQGKARTDAWRQKIVGGLKVVDGRVVPDSSMTVLAPESGVCYPAVTASDEKCTAPGSWFNPTLDFLANAPRDPEAIVQQLHDEAVAEEARRTGPGGDFSADDKTFSAGNLAYLELNFLRRLLTGNGVPADLEVALEEAVKLLPGIQTQPDTANVLGEKGTGYSLPDYEGRLFTVIFDADGHYIGAPDQAVVHGLAPALGEPPSRLID
ncbi:hypothetical protein [Actinophytocola algeriensis]|uniref:CU044_5270 family protein n=1 Tax=Actinophytocola algeriensis TaxID=1768010 RepID=A0A7W7VEK1_9PSEU|nr:hypothetical protein [Actinophytocola algeriensis]MBB4907095.1 hypothetical protein [Actinophytocola algeriensis]MBE1478578.1 hypothetical protein [Actinophytocola algeriensis]